jgi:hypothetical protein
MKLANAKVTKDAKKQAKALRKEGWMEPAGEASIDKQLTKAQLYGEEMMECVEEHRHSKNSADYGASAIVNAIAIFGKERVRAWCGGVPEVFGNGSEEDVRKILYPEWVNWKGTRLE